MYGGLLCTTLCRGSRTKGKGSTHYNFVRIPCLPSRTTTTISGIPDVDLRLVMRTLAVTIRAVTGYEWVFPRFLWFFRVLYGRLVLQRSVWMTYLGVLLCLPVLGPITPMWSGLPNTTNSFSLSRLPPRGSEHELGRLSFRFPRAKHFTLPRRGRHTGRISLAIGQTSYFTGVFLRTFQHSLRGYTISAYHGGGLTTFSLLLRFPTRQFSGRVSTTSHHHSGLVPVHGRGHVPKGLYGTFYVLPNGNHRFPSQEVFFRSSFSLPINRSFRQIHFPGPRHSTGFLQSCSTSRIVGPASGSYYFRVGGFLLVPACFPWFI